MVTIDGGGSRSPIDQCPSCDRKLESMTDFPIVEIVSIDHLVTAGTVPDILPHGDTIELVEKNRWFSTPPVVPPEVLRYFNGAPAAENYLHTDSRIYYPIGDNVSPYGRRWRSQRNYAPEVRALLQDDKAVSQYLRSLGRRVGQEVPTKEIFPYWPSGGYVGEGNRLFVIPQPGGSPIPFLYFRTYGHGLDPGSASLCLATRISRQRDVDTVLQIATLRYVGKLRTPAAPPAPSLAATG